MAIDATSQTFLQSDSQSNLTETAAGLLAETHAGNAADAQIGRWFSTQHVFLEGALNVVANEEGATISPTLDATQQSVIDSLAPLTGTGFDTMYLTTDIMGHQSNLAAHQAYVAAATNPVVTQLATAETPIIQDHLYELQLLAQEQNGGAAPTVAFLSTFTASPPLASTGVLSTQDQTFIDAAYNDATTGVDEGMLAMSKASTPNTQVYGAWDVVNDGPLNADVASLASALGATVPGAISAASMAQIATLQGLSGTAFDTQASSYAISDYQQAISDISAEATGGSSPALVALAAAALPTAEQLLAQAVILHGESGGGLTDTTAAPTTYAGSLLNSAANAAATGTAAIAGFDATAISTPSTGQTGIQYMTTSGVAASGYGFVIDASATPATITGAASQFEAVMGSAQGMTYYGGTSGSGDIALAGGSNTVLGAADAGAYFVGVDGGNNAIYAGNGSDTVATSGGTNVIGLGSGANAVVSGANDTVYGSSGTDTVFASAGTDQVFAGSKGVTYVAGGAALGLVETGSAASTVFGGGGAFISIGGAGAGSLIVAASGNETLQGSGLTAGATFFAGSGSDVLTGGAGNDAILAGTGNATISGGGGANLIQFIDGKAGGSDTVAFGADDKLSLVGYGSTAAQQAVSSSTATAGGVSFTLADNTHVTLTGVSALTTSDFV